MSEIVQVSLRGTRKDFFLNSRNLWLRLRDKVIVQSEHGDAIGSVFLKDPALIALKPTPIVPQLYLVREANLSTLYWNADGFTLQQSPDMSGWTDVSGTAGQSPITLTNSGSVFYRLRN